MEKDLTKGNITKTLLLFAVPMILGNLLQQFYNITDTVIVGRFIGSDALAAVGSAYTLMTFLTSVIIGLCMGCGALFSMYYGAKRMDELRESLWVSFWLILFVTLAIYGIVFAGTDGFCAFYRRPRKFMILCTLMCGLFLSALALHFCTITLLLYCGLWGIPYCR